MTAYRKRVSKLRISSKLILFSYSLLTPILLLISGAMAFVNYRTAVRAEETRQVRDVQNLSQSLESLMTGSMEYGTYLMIDNEISRILTSPNPGELNQDTRLWFNNTPIPFMEDMLAINTEIKTVAIYPENGVTPYLRCIDMSAYQSDFDAVRESGIYKEAIGDGRRYFWLRVEKGISETYSNNRSTKVVMYREMYDLAQKERLGFIAVGSLAESYDELLKSAVRGENESAAIVSRNGALLSAEGISDEELILAIREQPGEVVQTDSDGAPVSIYRTRGFTAYSCQSDETDAFTVKLVQNTGVWSILRSVLGGPLALLFGFLIGLYPLMRIATSRILVRPLDEVRTAMRKLQKGDFDQTIEVHSEDEVGELAEGFNEMARNTKQLIDRNYVLALREKESELSALQAQINPHFLYNALDSLYWKALEKGDEDLGEDILALSDLFRLALGRGKSFVPVRNEAELLDRYLYLQKMRFGDRLQYRIEMAEDIREEFIPKLILQPFVENAVVHGFEKKQDAFTLRVTGHRDGDYLAFFVLDTGIGMSEEQVSRLFEEEDSRSVRGQRIGRYAVKNVRERLEIAYHGDYRLEITSEEGVGTQVFLMIPGGKYEAEAADRG